MADFTLLESHRKNCLESYRAAVSAMSQGSEKKANKYCELARESCKYIIEHSPDKSERLQYRKFLNKIDGVTQRTIGTSDSDSDGSNNGENKPQEARSESTEPVFTFNVEKRPQTRFSDVVGQEQAIHELKKKGVYPMREPQLAKEYNADYGGLIILYGPPGTGKTLTVRALAGELGADFYHIKGSDFRDMYVGNSEKKIAALFKQASKSKHAVIFIDEGDTVFMKRGTSEHAAKEGNEWLQHIDGFKGKPNILIVTACNQPWLIDPAIISRGKLIYVPLPTSGDRAEIFRHCLPEDKIADDVDINSLAEMTERYAGRNISEACADANAEVFCAAVEAKAKGDTAPRKITQAILVRALQEHKPIYNEADMRRYEEYAKTA